MRPRVLLTVAARLGAGLAGIALAVAAALPAWAEPTPQNSDDSAYRAGYLLGRLLPALCCFVVLVALVAVLVILVRRGRDRRPPVQPPPNQYPPNQYPPNQYPPYR